MFIEILKIENRTILIGDVLEKIIEIPDDSIDCTISSPPYWGLRNYGDPGQWGLEPDFQDYLAKMQSLMNEMKRVTKSTGTVWINLGDCYSSSGGLSKPEHLAKANVGATKSGEQKGMRYIPNNTCTIENKSRVGIPERFYINCIDSGWIARNHIPWIKSNPMPSSVKDRFTNTWESVFFFAKKQKYYFNLDAVREKTITEIKQPKPKQEVKVGKLFEDDSHVKMEMGLSDYERGNLQPDGRSHFGTGGDIKKHMIEAQLKKESAIDRLKHMGYGEFESKQSSVIDPKTNKPKLTYLGFNERWKNSQWMYNDIGAQGQAKSLKERSAYARRVLGLDHDACLTDPRGKNPGDVIYDKSKPYAVVERHGTIIHRRLPDQEEIRHYLSEWRKKSKMTIDQIEEYFGNQAGHHWFERDGSYPTASDWLELKLLIKFDDKFDSQMLTEYEKPAEKENNPRGKNPGDIFMINTQPMNLAHFATFPVKLPTRILKCSCPEQVCKNCSKPRFPITEPTEEYKKLLGKSWHDHENDLEEGMSQEMDKVNAVASYKIVGWTDCHCNAGWEAGIVLDPFFGAGTVGIAAELLGLNWVGIEIKKEYVSEIITKRLDKHKNTRMNEFL